MLTCKLIKVTAIFFLSTSMLHPQVIFVYRISTLWLSAGKNWSTNTYHRARNFQQQQQKKEILYLLIQNNPHPPQKNINGTWNNIKYMYINSFKIKKN